MGHLVYLRQCPILTDIFLQSSHWFMLPWIVAKFMILAVFLVIGVGAIILINVYDVFNGDTSLAIAVGVINAAFLGK